MLSLLSNVLCSALVPGWLGFLMYISGGYCPAIQSAACRLQTECVGIPGITGNKHMGLLEGH